MHNASPASQCRTAPADRAPPLAWQVNRGPWHSTSSRPALPIGRQLGVAKLLQKAKDIAVDWLFQTFLPTRQALMHPAWIRESSAFA